jgi:murein DD-endopeptidase MepM/ murein hydrolase activator NlpD
LKRVLKKVKLVPSTISRDLVEANSVEQKVYRRIRGSAAMIGLAIMGASSLLLTQQSDRAAAAEPTVADPSATSIPAANETAVTATVPMTMVTSTVARIAPNGTVSLVSGLDAALKAKTNEQSVVPATLAIPQITPVVKLGETLGQTSPAYRLDASNTVNIAMLNQSPVAVLSSRVASNVVPQQTVMPIVAPMTPASNADNVSAQLKAKQELALSRLKAKSNRLKDSLAQLRSDETQKEAASVAPPTIVAQPSQVVAVALNNTSPLPVAATSRVAKKVSFIGTAIQQTNVDSIAAVKVQSVSVPTAAIALNPTVNTPVASLAPAPNQQLLAQTPVDANNSQYSPYAQSLRSEIDQLRAKYRAQQAGNANAPATTATPKVATPVPAAAPRSQFANNQYLQLNNSQYSASQQAASQAVNPEFIPIQVPQVQRTPRVRMATAPMGVDASQTLGGMRGRTVMPELPTLPSQDNYLPNPNFPSNPGISIPSQSPMNGLMWPAKGTLTSGFGPRWGRMHKGIDIANSVGTPIFAAGPGVIVSAGYNNGGYGYMVEVQHPDRSITRYAHNSRILVQVGQQVNQGQQISLMGNTGHSTGPHCHFEVHPGGQAAVNPIAFLPPR